MKFADLRHFTNFRSLESVKVLRHHDSDSKLWDLLNDDRKKFYSFQNNQSWDVFGRAEFVISFLSERNRFARFVGVWKVLSKRRKKTGGIVYRTVELEGFEDLSGRVIVRWGAGTRSWSQWLHRGGNKEVVEIRPPNSIHPFRNYYDVHLSYGELQQMVSHPDSNQEWQRRLVAVSGVYLIVDQISGKQYVGSAYGSGGIWSRWRNYAKTASGGNKLLRQLLVRNPGREKAFLFSIMRVLEPGAMKADVLAHEALVKTKLGCRAFGLNAN